MVQIGNRLGRSAGSVPAATTGALTVDGDPQAAKRLRKIFSGTPMLAQLEAPITGATQQA